MYCTLFPSIPIHHHTLTPTEMQYKPTHDWLIAKKQSAPTVDPIVRGIIRPNNPTLPHHFAEVVAVGPGRAHPQTGYTPALPCQVGDTIMVRHMAGDPETIDGTEYHWFQPDEVLAVVPKRERAVFDATGKVGQVA